MSRLGLAQTTIASKLAYFAQDTPADWSAPRNTKTVLCVCVCVCVCVWVSRLIRLLRCFVSQRATAVRSVLWAQNAMTSLECVHVASTWLVINVIPVCLNTTDFWQVRSRSDRLLTVISTQISAKTRHNRLSWQRRFAVHLKKKPEHFSVVFGYQDFFTDAC